MLVVRSVEIIYDRKPCIEDKIILERKNSRKNEII